MFFSDAVVAIAVTLLALDLPVPSGGSDMDMWGFAGEHATEYLAFLVSFLVIASHWSAHHRVFSYLQWFSTRLFQLNMVWLCLIILTPFATRVIYGDGAFLVRFGFYAAVQALLCVVMILMKLEMSRNDLCRDDLQADTFAYGYWVAGSLGVGFAVSIPVALLVGQWAFLCWAAAPLALRVVRGLRGSRRRRAVL